MGKGGAGGRIFQHCRSASGAPSGESVDKAFKGILIFAG
jgi:hypothetical protein